ncbi:MAG: PilZN3 domain-containing protein [Spirochaetales bacterium]
MAINTSQQISHYYDAFANQEITFTKEVLRTTRLLTKQVHLRCLGYQWPCIIYSSSMTEAKVIVNMTDSLKGAIRKSNSLVSLRFSFAHSDKTDPVSFFVSAKISGFTPYSSENRNLSFLSLTFTQRPPDGLIEVLGGLLQANQNSTQRRDERIPMSEDTASAIGLQIQGVQLFVQGVPRKCILRDLSFGGAKVILMGIPKFLLNKEVVLRIPLVEHDRPKLDLPGTAIRFEPVEGRSDIAAFAIQFDAERLPMTYKLKLSEYLNAESSPKARAAERARQQNEALESRKAEAAKKARNSRAQSDTSDKTDNSTEDSEQ